MHTSNLRPLRPHGAIPPPQTPSKPPTPRGRRNIIAACDPCRQHKTRCDGERPNCSACVRRGRRCTYSTDPFESRQVADKRKQAELARNLQDLEISHEPLRQLVHALQTSPESVATTMLQRLRNGWTIDSIIQQQAADPIMQTRLTPETNLRYVFPYRTQMPRALQIPTNPYLNTTLYEAAYLGERTAPGDAMQSQMHKYISPYEKPYSASTVIDPRLDIVKPSDWTIVSVTDDILRTALKRYFLYEYQFFSGFHKDLFLDDMISGSTQYCSPLLVNAVLALSCNCCPKIPKGHDFWDPQKVGYQLFAEARRLWDLAIQDTPSVTTVQAGTIISIIYDLYALDKTGFRYAACSLRLAHGLGLFESAPDMAVNDRRRWIAEGFTAWSLYFWTSLKCNMLSLPPLSANTPAAALPDPQSNPDWYGDTRVQYSLDETLYSLNHPELFKSKCELSMILNDMGKSMFDDAGNRIPAPSQQQLRKHLSALGAWRFSLPAKLKEAHIVFPFELNLHLLYLIMTINIGEMLVSSLDDSEISSGFTRANLEHAKICFETVMRLYYLRHGYDIPDGHLSHCSIMLAYRGLSQRYRSTEMRGPRIGATLSQDEARSTLILAAKALAEQGRNYYLPRALFDIVEHEMSSSDRDVLRQYVTVEGPNSESLQIRQNYISSQFPVGVNHLIDVEDKRRLDHLKKEIPEVAEERAHSSSR